MKGEATTVSPGVRAAGAAVEGGAATRLWVAGGCRNRRVLRLADIARRRGISVVVVSESELDRKTDNARHQGVAAETPTHPAHPAHPTRPVHPVRSGSTRGSASGGGVGFRDGSESGNGSDSGNGVASGDWGSVLRKVDSHSHPPRPPHPPRPSHPSRPSRPSRSDSSRSDSFPILLVGLDGVTDPRNLGAVMRTARAFGADAVFVPRNRCAPLSPVARKAAAGAAETLPLVRVPNLARALDELRDLHVDVVGAAEDGESVSAQTLAADSGTALILGGEGGGLRRLTRDKCDRIVRIPTVPGPAGCLNVSVACGALLAEISRQRKNVL